MVNTCKWIMKSGPCTGLECGRNCIRNYCSKHHGMYTRMNAKLDTHRQIIEADKLYGNIATPSTNPFEADVRQNEIPDYVQMGGRYAGVITPKKKVKFTTILFTINSQKDASKLSDEDRNKFKSFINKYLLSDDVFQFFTDDNSKDNVKKNIVSVEQKGEIEIGNKVNRYHAHAIIKIEHTGFFHFQPNKFRDFAKKELGYTIHLDSKFGSETSRIWEQYMAKSKLDSAE